MLSQGKLLASLLPKNGAGILVFLVDLCYYWGIRHLKAKEVVGTVESGQGDGGFVCVPRTSVGRLVQLPELAAASSAFAPRSSEIQEKYMDKAGQKAILSDPQQ